MGSKTMQVTWGGQRISITVTKDGGKVEEWIKRQNGKMYGMDVEWKPDTSSTGADNKVALLQLCGDGGCVVVQLLYLNSVPLLLSSFLKNPQVNLAGVGIKRDAEKLARDFHLECTGLVEVGVLAADKLNEPELERSSLEHLAQAILGITLEKPKNVTMSNWSEHTLTNAQVEYAAMDAYLSFAIAQKLYGKS